LIRQLLHHNIEHDCVLYPKLNDLVSVFPN